MATVFTAPNVAPKVSIFLAGSIDMGSAVDWQKSLIALLSDLHVNIYNPRRDDWDSSWEQSIDNIPFREQVEWELNHLEAADIICFYFDPAGPAPVTLMELGLYAHKNVMVCCPDGYWRKGNVEVVCSRYGIPIWNVFDNFAQAVYQKVKNKIEYGY